MNMVQNLPTELQWEILDHVLSSKDTKLDVKKLKALSEIPKMRSLVSKYVCVLSVIAKSSKRDYRKRRKHSASEARVSDNCIEVVIPDRLCTRVDQTEPSDPLAVRYKSLCTELKSEVRWKHLPLDLSDKLYAKNHKFLFIELHDYHKEPKDSVLLYRLPIWMFSKQRFKALNSTEPPQEPFVLPRVLDPPIPTHIDIIMPMKKGLKSMIDYDNYLEMAYFSRIAALDDHQRLPYNIDVNFAVLENKEDLMPTAKCLAMMQFLPDFHKRSTSAHAEEEKDKVLRLADHQNTLCVDTIKSLSGSLVSKCPCCHSKRYQTQLANLGRLFWTWEATSKRWWFRNGPDRVFDDDMRLFSGVAWYMLDTFGWPVSQFPIVQDPLGRLARGLYTLGSNFGYMSQFMEGYLYSDLAERDIRISERTAQVLWGAAIARAHRHYPIHRQYDPEVDIEQRPCLSDSNPNIENSLSIDLVFFKEKRDVFAAHHIRNKASYDFLVEKCHKLDILYSKVNSERGYPSRFQSQNSADSVLNRSNLYHHTLPDSKLSTRLKHWFKKLFQLKPDLCKEKAQYLDWYHQFLSLLCELPVISHEELQLLNKRFGKAGQSGSDRGQLRGLNWLTLRNLRFQKYQNSLEKLKVESE